MKELFQYYWIRYTASRELDRERGEVSATTVVMAAALVALAISVSALTTFSRSTAMCVVVLSVVGAVLYSRGPTSNGRFELETFGIS